jgi:hypothetical protein
VLLIIDQLPSWSFARDAGLMQGGIARLLRGGVHYTAASHAHALTYTAAGHATVLEGQIRYRIGSLPVFIADQGDIFYAPKQTWHLASFAGNGTSTRLAMNGYPEMLHNYQPQSELGGRGE